MKAIAFANRLVRSLEIPALSDVTADIRQEILDAINGGLQRIHSLSPFISKLTVGSIPLAAPLTITLTMTNGSAQITGYDFTSDQFYKTIRVSGDTIDNQVIDVNELLHPYSGPSGSVSAILYCDAATMPEPYDEIIGNPRILETNDTVYASILDVWLTGKQVERPTSFFVEANARNQNPPAPAVIRFNSLPDQLYRLEAQFTLAPARVKFSDLLDATVDIPLRDEFIELYLLPISRAMLVYSSFWKDADMKARAVNHGESAEEQYRLQTNSYLSTPNNSCGTTVGW